MHVPHSSSDTSASVVPAQGDTALSPSGPQRPPQRHDLDGLRGVAIALVVVFHIWMGRVSGGVDVFLTLSGFFFTASLLRSAEAGASLNPFTRITRVLRRLGPPLLITLAAVAVASVFLLPRTRWADLGDQLVSGVFYYVNWQLATTANDYLAADPSVSPLQHLWSVAVQFQFYLLAIAVVFGLAWIRRTVRPDGPRSFRPLTFAVIFAVIAVVSFVYAADGVRRHQAWNYYDTGARLWEIMLGAAVAAVFAARSGEPSTEPSSDDTRTRSQLRGALAGIGIAIIVACGFLVDGVSAFPGPLALIPVLATLALIVAGSETAVAATLSNRFFAWLGSIAFPLYLWHWPLLIFYLSATGRPHADVLGGLGIVGASVALAWLTVRLVERPTQSPTFTPARIAVTATAAIAAVTVTAGSIGWNFHIDRSINAVQADGSVDEQTHPGALELTDGIRVEPADVSPPLYSAPEDLPATTLEGCIADFETRDAVSCTYGDVDSDRTIVLAGSSHAEHWVTALDTLGLRHGFAVVTFLKMGCPLSTDTMPMLGPNEYPDCLDWTQTVLAEVAEMQPDYLFTTATRPREDAPGDFTPPWYASVWQQLTANGVGILGIRDTPWLAYRAIDCLADGGTAASCGIPRDEALDPVNPALASSFQLPGFSALDLSDAVCDDTVCRAEQGNVLIYRDEHHLTATYVRTLTTELGRQIGSATGWWAGP
ncbi:MULTISPECIES: acyltransferase family protein [unclassified Rhodococcus (in: high G+C Gram-positive bacteria)]|uniref:acyltransferase family protein n=1 Tax=unclassified Rhodococcus (in: high G+C Gram-positive bacteria) TaxID=192944 RepID=UPI000B9B65F7|nr:MULTISPECIES: acyltransferase family protein [unclassified Rhodococcus (in: high G+C Gram-positive bacteria)]OZE35350.1 acyltransferase [Rhodococcus sp. 05-2254-4]OZE47778.1 acyltransferase [Rhodococcus sp. 05-2254-3]OZE48989.1 acyltransferase [Rhodococcus sp. 05-2254-2]